MPFDRRKLLQTGLLTTASALAHPRGFAAILRQTDPLFTDTFDTPTVAQKPLYTVLADVQDGFRWLHTPSIIEGRNGTLLASWSSNGPRGDEDPTNFLELVRSTDKGVTWSRPVAITSPSTIGPIFLRTKDNDPVLFYLRNHSLKQDDCSIVFRRTKDDGLTWGEEMPVDIGATVAIIVNNGIMLPNGDWMISFHYDMAQQGDHFAVTKASYMACVAVSSDEGKTWKRYDAGTIPNEQHSPNALSWAVEPAVILTANGMLRMVIRSMNGYLYETTSKDLGKTWSPIRKTIFSNDNSKPSVLELSGGKEMLMWNDTRILDFQFRSPLIATLSEDDGQTWFRSVTIEDAQVTLDYPTAVQMGDSIKLIYGFDRRQMRFIDLHEADFKPWTPINDAGSWKVADGVLEYTGDRPGILADTAPDWMHWSKVVSFLPKRGTNSTMSVDFRFDETWAKDAVLGVFAAYQDESNWTAWCWHPAIQKAGFQQELHFGSVTHPFYARNSSNFFFDHMEAPVKGAWYTVHITTAQDGISYRLLDKATGKELLTGSSPIAWEGQFIGLGSRNAVVSFDNVVVR
jgi:predicted neuraminidase